MFSLLGAVSVAERGELVISKIISGGQTGGDKGGLRAGKRLDLETGGFCPARWKTDKGEDLELKEFGLVCLPSSGYIERTEKNVCRSDATVGFGNQYSPGMRLTQRYCKEWMKPYLAIPYPSRSRLEDIERFIEWLKMYGDQIKVLNIAGNRERMNYGIERYVEEFLVEALSKVIKRGERSDES